MTTKETREMLEKIKSPIVREIFLDSFNSMDKKERAKFAKVMQSFKDDLENDLNFRAKAIAAYVRYNMEDFHAKNLSDKQMKELNPIIRNAIYTFLKDEADGDLVSISALCNLNLPSYWEDCEYVNVHSSGIEFDDDEEENS